MHAGLHSASQHQLRVGCMGLQAFEVEEGGAEQTLNRVLRGKLKA